MWKRMWHEQQGQALVELAISLTLLIIIILGIVEFGRIGYSYIIVTHATREGARSGALNSSDHEIYKIVNESLIALGNVPVHVAISPAENLRQRREPISVDVTVQLPLITPLAGILPNPFAIQSTMIMRVE